MAHFDDVVLHHPNWNGGYTGNPPQSEDEHNALMVKFPDMWKGEPMTWDEIQSGIDNLAYAENREREYPSLNELVVALWEGVVEERMESVTALEELRQAVKAKYPKPEL